jgi:hypothetical protein
MSIAPGSALVEGSRRCVTAEAAAMGAVTPLAPGAVVVERVRRPGLHPGRQSALAGCRGDLRQAVTETAPEIDRVQRLLHPPERFGAAEEERAGPRKAPCRFGDDLGLELLAKVDQDVAQQDEIEARFRQAVRQAREIQRQEIDPGAQARSNVEASRR